MSTLSLWSYAWTIYEGLFFYTAVWGGLPKRRKEKAMKWEWKTGVTLLFLQLYWQTEKEKKSGKTILFVGMRSICGRWLMKTIPNTSGNQCWIILIMEITPYREVDWDRARTWVRLKVTHLTATQTQLWLYITCLWVSCFCWSVFVHLDSLYLSFWQEIKKATDQKERKSVWRRKSALMNGSHFYTRTLDNLI